MKSTIQDTIKSLGLVFGDIGTSPIYTLTIIFLLTPPTESNIIGVLSLIVWSLIIIVTGEYAWLAMSLSKKGEGGTIVLKEILVSLLSSQKKKAFVTLLSFVGISLLIGDGVITPAISILSAVEGSLLIPNYGNTSQETLIAIASIIAIVLFLVQSKGTGIVAGAFGPIMVVWFGVLIAFGIRPIMDAPQVLKAINPYYAALFFADHGFAGILVLSQVILCATGGEALYADMGHLGRKPILRAWVLVFVALIINYLGQGAYIIIHPEAKNVLYSMVMGQLPVIYIPFLVLSIIATIIASQAMISGMFSIVYQGITTHIMPLFKVDYTSVDLRSQIYIGSVNWFLLFAVLFVILQFRESNNLAAAYGLAVNCDMVLTSGLMIWIFLLTKKRFKAGLSVFIFVVVLFFLWANIHKLPLGGYWSLLIGAIPFSIIMLYTRGQRRLYSQLQPISIENFLPKYREVYRIMGKCSGTALFFARGMQNVPPYIVNTMFSNNIIYEDNITVSIVRRDDPFGVTWFFREELAEGLRQFEIQFGYMEMIDVEQLLLEAGIEEKTIFYGVEDIVTRSLVWKLFSVIKRLTPSFVQFYKLPPHKLHGVVTRVEM
jgi:KUP system potassium uptake protein